MARAWEAARSPEKARQRENQENLRTGLSLVVAFADIKPELRWLPVFGLLEVCGVEVGHGTRRCSPLLDGVAVGARYDSGFVDPGSLPWRNSFLSLAARGYAQKDRHVPILWQFKNANE